MGSSVGITNAAYMYEAGYADEEFFGGNEKIDELAFNLHMLAAKLDLADAHMKLGDYYYYGKGGVEKDLPLSISLYKVASENHVAQASFNLGYMHQMGEGVAQDFHIAKRFYDLAVMDLPTAQYPVSVTMIFWAIHFVWQEGYAPIEMFLQAQSSSSSETFTSLISALPFEWDVMLMIVLGAVFVAALLVRIFLSYH
mmetsp:Transcript_10114/g.15273  ORF Transcript_10114/g.15273 Transcript_10114/m.15273 type:complete len:197 (-) Transcript_10114:39-629(-)